MDDNKQRNPFEEHIESEAFDVSKLENSAQIDQSDIGETGRRVQAFLESLPQPLSHELWDTHLSDEQKRICAHLTIELVDRVLKNHPDDRFSEFTDEQLTYLLTVPVLVSMLAEERLHRQHQQPPSRQQKTSAVRSTSSTTTSHPLHESEQHSAAEDTLSELGDRLKVIGQRVKEFLVRLYERLTS
jgi:hypothetical protein